MRKAKILLVEDEAAVLSLNKKHLEKQGYEIYCADTLAAARNMLWENPPDLIVLDVLMPDGDGYDFCAEIRRNTTAPILYLTCMDKDEHIVRGLMEGGDDYLTKPYNLDVLFARVMALLRRQGFANAGRIELPPLTIDLLTGRATLDGVEIPLSRKELQLLACLAGSMGRTFTATELYETLWGGEADNAGLNAVYVHASNLRKKLGLDDASPFEFRSAKSGSYTLLKVSYGQGL
ncbi:response regulator transcription factor [Oscillospiraceae bacterium OttesenSCG-928-G22]|nr:response regulator transcription factor [Oscillospiraceae bacterium OttesenSCG-928-G22]